MLSHTHQKVFNLLTKDLKESYSYGYIYMLSLTLCKNFMNSRGYSDYQIDIMALCLQAGFEVVYGFSYATAARSLTMHAADVLEIPKDKAELLGDAVHSAVSLMQDITPLGMARTTVYNFGKLTGYYFGFWTGKKILPTSDCEHSEPVIASEARQSSF